MQLVTWLSSSMSQPPVSTPLPQLRSCQHLKALTHLSINVVVVIHQARQEIFESFDSLVLLVARRMIYHSPEKQMQSHFKHLIFQFSDHNNLADVKGDSIAGKGRLYKKTSDASIFPVIEEKHNTHQSHIEMKAGPKVSISVSERNNLNETASTAARISTNKSGSAFPAPWSNNGA